jgi:hypothetical protein
VDELGDEKDRAQDTALTPAALDAGDHKAEYATAPLASTWKVGLVALVAAAALVIVGTFRTLYTYSYPVAHEHFNGAETFWTITSYRNLNPPMPAPGYGVPLLAAAALLIVSTVVLLLGLHGPSAWRTTIGRALALAATGMLGGVVWTVFLYVANKKQQVEDAIVFTDKGVFDIGDGLLMQVIACGAAVVGSVLVSRRAVGQPEPAGPAVYRVDDGSETQSGQSGWPSPEPGLDRTRWTPGDEA